MTRALPRATERAGGDRVSAIAELAQRCGRRGHAIAFDLLRDPSEAEDAVQEALARAFESYEKLRDRDALDAWFFRTLSRWCLKRLRRRRISNRIAALIPGRPSQKPARTEPALVAALATLSPHQTVAVVLRHAHEWSVAEIASHLGVRPNTVKTHLTRGLARLRELLGDVQ